MLKTLTNGCTALMYAADRANEETVSVLLAAGADPNLQNNRHETALILAQRRGGSGGEITIGKLTLFYATKRASEPNDPVLALLLRSGARP